MTRLDTRWAHRQCLRKVRYPTREEAEQARQDPSLETYRCPWCSQGWHNGHRGKGRSRRGRAA